LQQKNKKPLEKRKIVTHNQPCLNPKCQSSDARQVYEGGTSYCFSCSTFFPSEGKELVVAKKGPTVKTELTIDEVKEFPTKGFADRKISKVVADHYNIKVSLNEEGDVAEHFYPYGGAGGISGYKVRKLPKEFYSIGRLKGLFGQMFFNAGGKRLVITEGEVDALSVAQANYDEYKVIYPVIALRSSTSVKDLLDNRDYIRSFDEVVLMFDQDEAGKAALEEAIKIVGLDKVKIAKTGKYKDANELLVAEGSKALIKCVWDAQRYTPVGIVGKEEIWDQLVNYSELVGIPYPECLEGVGTKLKYIRLGEIVTLISGTGSGKSSIVREILLHLLEAAPEDHRIGGLFLEESPAEVARKLSGMYLQRNPDHEELTLEDLKPGFDAVFGSDRLILIDHQGSLEDDQLIEQLEYMCLSGCKYIFIDHITILASEGTEGLSENQAVDKIMNDLLRLAKRHNVWIGLVSHLRKAPNGKQSFEEGRIPSIDDIKGSGSIKQVSFDIIAFARNLIAESEEERNTIRMRVLKARRTGLTGDVAGARYCAETGRLTGMNTIVMEDGNSF
jgi:twinkle protein